jgi:hypothetical protein
MFVFEILVALVLAVLLTGVLSASLRRRGPGPLRGVLFFFLILFLAIWAGGIWVRPMAPYMWDLPWIGFLLVGVLLMFILAATSPPRPIPKPDATPPAEDGAMAEAALGLFFYLALLGLLAAIGTYYILGVG